MRFEISLVWELGFFPIKMLKILTALPRRLKLPSFLQSQILLPDKGKKYKAVRV